MGIFAVNEAWSFRGDGAYNQSIANALVEGAKSDMAMFEAMMKVEAREASMRRAGVYTEATEASGIKGAFNSLVDKIKKGLEKLKEMIKRVASAFYAKVLTLINADKKLLDKYAAGIEKNADKYKDVEIKNWRAPKKGIENLEDTINSQSKLYDIPDAIKSFSDNAEDRYKYYCGKSSASEFRKYIIDDLCLEEASDTTIGNIGVSNIINTIKNFKKNNDYAVATRKKMIANLDSVSKSINAEKEFAKAQDNDDSKQLVEDYSHANIMLSTFRDLTLAGINASQEFLKIVYKQSKAAFVKMVGTKLESESALLDVVVEAVQDEVDDVIDSAVDSETISDVNLAATSVLDPDVSDDPNKLVYDKDDCYSQTVDTGDEGVDGSVDTDINSKNEAAQFSFRMRF